MSRPIRRCVALRARLVPESFVESTFNFLRMGLKKAALDQRPTDCFHSGAVPNDSRGLHVQEGSDT